jgi:hypothetical protein
MTTESAKDANFITGGVGKEDCRFATGKSDQHGDRSMFSIAIDTTAGT